MRRQKPGCAAGIGNSSGDGEQRGAMNAGEQLDIVMQRCSTKDVE
jgi:hypothetical protein